MDGSTDRETQGNSDDDHDNTNGAGPPHRSLLVSQSDMVHSFARGYWKEPVDILGVGEQTPEEDLVTVLSFGLVSYQ